MPPDAPRKKLGQMLKEAGVLDDNSLRLALSEQAKWGGPLGRMLVDMGLVHEEVLVSVLAKQLGVATVDLKTRLIDASTFDLIPLEVAQHYQVLPMRDDARTLEVAMSDPTNAGMVEELRLRTGRNIKVFLAGPRAITDAINRNYRSYTPAVGMDVGAAFGIPLASRTPAGSKAPRPDPASRDSVVVFDEAVRTPPSVQAAMPDPMRTPPTAQPSMPAPQQLSALPTLAAKAARPGQTDERAKEIQALQARVVKMEGLLARDEEVIRRLIGLLVRKQICTREEIVEWLK